jgi:hypothetical protein
MRCEDALRLLAEFLDRELASVDHLEVKRHLSICRSCYSRAEFERRLKRELSLLRATDISDRLERQIQSLIVGSPISPLPVPED